MTTPGGHGANDVNLAALWIPVMPETSHMGDELKKAGTEAKKKFEEGWNTGTSPEAMGSSFSSQLMSSINKGLGGQEIPFFSKFHEQMERFGGDVDSKLVSKLKNDASQALRDYSQEYSKLQELQQRSVQLEGELNDRRKAGLSASGLIPTMQEQARLQGQINTQTTAASAAYETYNGKLGKLQDVTGAVTQSSSFMAGVMGGLVVAGVQVAVQGMEQLAEKLIEGVVEGFKMAVEAGKEFAETMVEIGEKYEHIGIQITEFSTATGEQFEELEHTATEVFNSLDVAGDNTGKTLAQFTSQLDASGEAVKALTYHTTELQGRYTSLKAQDLASIFVAFKTPAEEADTALASLLQSARNSGQDLGQLASSLSGEAAITLKQAGLNLQQAGAFMGELMKLGPSGRSVMMGLNAAMKEFGKEGLSFSDGMKLAGQRLKELGDTAAGQDLAEKLFGTRRWSVAMEAVKEYLDVVHQGPDAFNASSDSMDTFIEKTRNLQNQWEEVKHRAMEAFAPVGERALELVSAGLDKAVEFVRGHMDEIHHAITQAGLYMISFAADLQKVAIAVLDFMAPVINAIDTLIGSSIAGLGSWASMAGKLMRTLHIPGGEDLKNMGDAAQDFGMKLSNLNVGDKMEKLSDWMKQHPIDVKGAGEEWIKFSDDVTESMDKAQHAVDENPLKPPAPPAGPVVPPGISGSPPGNSYNPNVFAGPGGAAGGGGENDWGGTSASGTFNTNGFHASDMPQIGGKSAGNYGAVDRYLSGVEASLGAIPAGMSIQNWLGQRLLAAGLSSDEIRGILAMNEVEGGAKDPKSLLGFTESQAKGPEAHVAAFMKQWNDMSRRPDGRSIPGVGSDGAVTDWQAYMAWIREKIVGQTGVSSDWQGNAQPSAADYQNRLLGALHFEKGGKVTAGSGYGDDVAALLKRGEYVWDTDTMDKYGWLIRALHQGTMGFDQGGGTDGGPAGVSIQSWLGQKLLAAGLSSDEARGILAMNEVEGGAKDPKSLLGFTESQAKGRDAHVAAFMKQWNDMSRRPDGKSIPGVGSGGVVTDWHAYTTWIREKIVGQTGVSSDWQGNAQPAAADYQNRLLGALHFEKGGKVTAGSGSRDDVAALLKRGEYVWDTGTMDKYGWLIRALHQGTMGFDQGGGTDSTIDNAILYGVPSGHYADPGEKRDDLSQGLADCSSAIEALVNELQGRGLKAPSGMFTGNEADWLLQHGFVPGMGGPGDFRVGFNSHHTQATLPGGTPFNWGSEEAAQRRGIGGTGADDPAFTSHYYLPKQAIFQGGDPNGGYPGLPGQFGGYGAYGGQTYDQVREAQQRVQEARDRKADLDYQVQQADKKVADLKDQIAHVGESDKTGLLTGQPLPLTPDQQKAADEKKKRLEDQLADAVHQADVARREAGEQVDKIDDAVRKQQEAMYKKPSGAKGLGAGKATGLEEFTQLGGGLIKGIAQEFGLGDIFAKAPWDWGIVKLATGLASWGIGTANAWAEQIGQGKTGIGGPGWGQNSGNPMPGWEQSGGSALSGMLGGLGVQLPKVSSAVSAGPNVVATQPPPISSGQGAGPPPGPMVAGDYMPINVTAGVDAKTVMRPVQEQRNSQNAQSFTHSGGFPAP